jgi:hypothetical protein
MRLPIAQMKMFEALARPSWFLLSFQRPRSQPAQLGICFHQRSPKADELEHEHSL